MGIYNMEKQYSRSKIREVAVLEMEKQYQTKLSPSMLADYCWAIKRDVPQAKYSRKSTEVIH